MSGDFRAAIFGANDGLVSNMALILGMVGTGASSSVVLVTGIAGLLAGALSMAAGEYVSVSSQQELLKASTPSPTAGQSVAHLDVQKNELELVYRARGMSIEDAKNKAQLVFASMNRMGQGNSEAHQVAQRAQQSFDTNPATAVEGPEEGGSPLSAAISSFFLFSVGALIPVLPYAFGMGGVPAAVVACILVGIALVLTGGIVGVLSGTKPLSRAFRQLLIGFGAAGITFLLGSLFNVTV